VDKPQFLVHCAMKSDNYRLIQEVSKRRCLWDTNMSISYRNQDAALQWASVAQIMQQDGEWRINEEGFICLGNL